MRKLPTTITTTEGSILQVSISPYDCDKDPKPTIRFTFEKGGLCSQYYLETFMAIPDEQGLCLDGRRYEYQSISADQVTICKMLIKSYELSNA